MRLYVKHIWRAFPELDRFSDEQCRRFTKAARRSRPLWLRLFHWLVQWAAWAACASAGLWALGAIERWTYSNNQPLTATYVWIAVSGVAALLLTVAGVLAWLLFSHLFLRRRIAWVLRARGRCAGCGYVLVGLPVTAGNRVVCPECGFEAEVDRSLGELSVSDDGRERYTPSADVLKRGEPWITRAFVVRWLKRAAFAAVALVFLAGVGWALNDLRLARQATRAKELVPGSVVLNDLMKTIESGGAARANGDPSPTAVELLAALNAKIAKASARAFPAGIPANIGPDGSYVEPSEPWLGDGEKERQLQDGPSRAMLAAMEEEGVFAAMREFGEAAVTGQSYTPIVPGEPIWQLPGFAGAPLRSLARWNGARMRLARRDNDPARFEDAVATTMGVASLLERQPSMDDRMNCRALQGVVEVEVRALLMAKPDARWLAAVERGLGAPAPEQFASLPFEGQRVVFDDITRWMFSDPSLVRGGIVNPKLRSTFVAKRMGVSRVGTLEESLAATDEVFKSIESRARQQRFERPATVEGGNGVKEGRGSLADWALPWMEAMLRSEDHSKMTTVGLRTLVALERYRLDKGDYPTTLAELTGTYLATPPIDIVTGRPLIYKRVDPKVDPQGRSFLLYSTGSDGVDNGGNGDGPWNVLHPGQGAGFDFVINNNKR